MTERSAMMFGPCERRIKTYAFHRRDGGGFWILKEGKIFAGAPATLNVYQNSGQLLIWILSTKERFLADYALIVRH